MGLKKSFNGAPGSIQHVDQGFLPLDDDIKPGEPYLIAKRIVYRVPKKGQELLPPQGFDINLGRLTLEVIIREPFRQPEGEEVNGKTLPEMIPRIASGFALSIRSETQT